MSLPYAVLGNFTGSISSGSFLNAQDTSLFLTTQSTDVFFGYSERDVIELSVFDTADNLISWSLLDEAKSFSTSTLTFIDVLNIPQSYTFQELNSDFIIYKGQDILFNMVNDLSASNIVDGSFKISHIFARQMAGRPNSRLVINDISPSRTEIKLLPSSLDTASLAAYTAFCIKKFLISDVSPILITLTQACPYDKIYNTIHSQYSNSITTLQRIFFLPDDASVVRFLKNLYEDYIKYTNLTQLQIDAGLNPTRVFRVQGIRSYFNNYLLQGNNIIADFPDIESKFDSFVQIRVDQAFTQYKDQTGQDFQDAKQFCIDFFTKFFYTIAVHPIQKAHQDKYFSYFKNVLNFGNNQYYPILTHDFLDERKTIGDPITLIIKLGNELPSGLDVKDTCWISNFGMVPFTETIILNNPAKFPTLKIGPPNFGTTTKFITKENVNKLYSSDDLSLNDTTQNQISVNKLIAKLDTDYSDFRNFVIFSSVGARLNIFKNKAKSYYILSSSLSTVTTRYLNSLSSSFIYPYFATEANSLQTQINDLVRSFDGYESNLFDQGNYTYSVPSASFVNELYITNNDLSASIYDSENRDSLINNTPEFIINDSNNQDYITFLAMIGHHFDNIYTYISVLPIEKHVKNQISSSLPLGTLKELLYSFGWNVDDIIGDLNIDEVYLNSLNAPIYDLLSAQERLKTIWNRILITLPGIFKTKGTEECVKFLMAAYGLPSSLISIREYGGTDFASDTLPTYKLDEKTYMLKFSGQNDYIEGPMPSLMKTVELKFAIDGTNNYDDYQRVSLFTVYPYSQSNAAWSVDFYRVPGQYTGKVALQMKSGSTGIALTSSILPIFNGKIFSIMIRRNYVDALFESAIDPNVVPIQYDLVVQRNEDGRPIFFSSASANFYTQDNNIFSQFGRFRFSDGTFNGTLDKLGIWNIPLDDSDFTEHVNDINSYGYSGSNSFLDLVVRLNWDYPANIHTGSPSAYWIDNRSPYYAIPNYHSSTWISSSIVPLVYSASQQIINSVWRPIYPTGSVDIIAWNFPDIIDPNWSASFNGCNFISNSIYPWNFREFEYQQDIDGSRFGPNKFRNKKIRKLDYTIESRFDSNDRSTFDPSVTISGESNQLGFFVDPQDSKNKDILRYVGKNGIMDLIGDPRDRFSDKYYGLVNKNFEYNSVGNKRTLFNELLTIYKFYFDKSIFEAIKNLVPARANLFTGVVIEPTILERPKYQNRPLNSSVDATYKSMNLASIDNIYTFSEHILWGNFTTSSLDIGYKQTIDLTDMNNGKREYDKNINRGYITDFMDKIQFGIYPDVENLQRQWAIPGLNPNDPVNYAFSYPIAGAVSRNDRGGKFDILPDPSSPDPSQFFVGLNTGSHPAVYYMMKVWDKYPWYTKSGSYSHSENPLEDGYESSSIYLYKYILVNEFYMRSLVYLTNLVTASVYNFRDLAYHFDGSGNYLHQANTFINTPDQTVSNVFALPGATWPFNPLDFGLSLHPAQQYFEIVRGYPRNHYTHKMKKFSKTKYGQFVSINVNVIYIKGRQTIDTTINTLGINDGSYPVASNNTSNVNVMNTGNVIQFVPSTAGATLPITNTSAGATVNIIKKSVNRNTTSTSGIFSQQRTGSIFR